MIKINEGIFRYINHLLELFMKKQYQMIQIIIIIRTIVINNQALLDVESMYRKF